MCNRASWSVVLSECSRLSNRRILHIAFLFRFRSALSVGQIKCCNLYDFLMINSSSTFYYFADHREIVDLPG